MDGFHKSFRAVLLSALVFVTALTMCVYAGGPMPAPFKGDTGSGGRQGEVPAPAAGDAAAKKVLSASGSWATPASLGVLSGPTSSVDNQVPRFDGATGAILQASAMYVDDAGAMYGITSVALGSGAYKGTQSETPLSADRAYAWPNESGGVLIGPTTTPGRGAILYRGASGWLTLEHGTAGQVFQTGGDGADPSWASASGSDTLATVTARGATAETTCSFESALAITLGKDAATNTAGSARFWSSGANDFSFLISAPAMSEDVVLTWPPSTGTDGAVLTRAGLDALTWSMPTLEFITGYGAVAYVMVECRAETALVIGYDQEARDNTAGRVKIISAGDNGYFTEIMAGTQTQTISYTLPLNDGDASQVLTTDGSGVLSWTAAGGGTDTLATVTARGATAETTCAFESSLAITLGKDAATNTAGKIRFWSAGANNYYTDIVASTQSQNIIYTLPANDGNNGYFLQTNGDGLLAWSLAPSLATVTASGSSSSGSMNIPTGYTLTVNSIDALKGPKEYYVDAGALRPNTTNGAVGSTIESTTNKVMDDIYWFDPDTNQSAQWKIVLPRNWNCGPVKFKVETYSASANESDFVFELCGQAQTDGSTWDSAWGETVQVTDTHRGAGKKSVGPASGYMTYSGTPGIGYTLYGKITRNATTAGDTLNESIGVTGITCQYNESQVANFSM